MMRKWLFILLFPTSLWAQDLEQVAQADPFSVAGSVGTQIGVYGTDLNRPRQNPFIWGVYGNLTANLFGVVNLPIGFSVGRQGNNFRYPTFAQYGISPEYKWIKVHLGHRRMNWSPYSLAGHTFLGAGVELTPKKFRFAAFSGRLRDQVLPHSSPQILPPSFNRRGLGFKIGVGTEESHVDLTWMKGRDADASIPDSLATPAENTVLGLNTRIKLSEALHVEGHGGLSLFTRDIRSETIGGDTLTDLPFIRRLAAFHRPTYSTRANLAGDLALVLRRPRFDCSLKYERIDPNYETMGAYFFANDLARWTINPQVRWLNRTLIMSGSLGLQRNNVLGTRSETTRRRVGSLNATYAPKPHYGVTVQYSNFSFFQSNGVIGIQDSLLFDQQTTSLGIIPRYTIQRPNQIWNFSASLFTQNSEQQLAGQQDQLGFYSVNLSFTPSLTLIAQNLTLLAGWNRTELDASGVQTILSGVTTTVTKRLPEHKLSTTASVTLNTRTENQVNNGGTRILRGSVGWNPDPQHAFSTQLYWLSNVFRVGQSFREVRWTLQYTYRFTTKKRK